MFPLSPVIGTLLVYAVVAHLLAHRRARLSPAGERPGHHFSCRSLLLLIAVLLLGASAVILTLTVLAVTWKGGVY
jgi:FlaG/FlaF family flagellin (archaellin)